MRVFISYRRDDSRDIAAFLGYRFIQKLGRENVFIDVDSIPIGQDYRAVVDDAITRSNAFVAVIGDRWLECVDENGRRRLDDEMDIVRHEIRTAMEMGRRVVPILVHGAKMPRTNQLPADLADLAFLQAAELREEPFLQGDMDRVLRQLQNEMGADPAETDAVYEEGVGEPERILLHEFLEAVQGWHDEVVRTLADLATVADKAEQARIEFVYLNTRKFLPRIRAIRRLLEEQGKRQSLVQAADGFLDLVTTTIRGADMTGSSCAPLNYRWDGPPGGSRFSRDDLPALQGALDEVAGEVIRLLARKRK